MKLFWGNILRSKFGPNAITFTFIVSFILLAEAWSYSAAPVFRLLGNPYATFPANPWDGFVQGIGFVLVAYCAIGLSMVLNLIGHLGCAIDIGETTLEFSEVFTLFTVFAGIILLFPWIGIVLALCFNAAYAIYGITLVLWQIPKKINEFFADPKNFPPPTL